jgi:hypothetical protein
MGWSLSGSKSKQSSYSGLDPRFADSFFTNVGGAQQTAAALPGMRTQDYYAGNDYIRNAASGHYGLSNMDSAAGSLRRAQNYSTPQMEAAMMDRGAVRDVDGGSFLNMNLGDYMNPYLQQVAGNVTQDMNRARQMQLGQGEDAALRAKSFGGSRHGVADAETNRSYYDRLGSTLDSIYAGGFNAATGLAGQDLGRGLQANLSNQGQDWNVGSLNTSNEQQARLENLRAELAAQSMRQSAAQGLSSIGQMQQAGAMTYGGALQDMGMQNVLMALKQQGLLNDALGTNPGGGSGMTSTSSGSSKSFGFGVK